LGAFGLFHPDGARTSSIFYQVDAAPESYGSAVVVGGADNSV